MGPMAVRPEHLRASLLFLLPMLAFGASIGFGFVDWDDPLLLTQNPWVQGFTWQNIAHAFTAYDPELYVPLTTLSYLLNYATVGLSPWLYHATNVALHIANVFLVYTIAKRWLEPRAALIGALLFAVHPLHAEAVVWAAARKDLLSATFALGSLLLWLRWQAADTRSTYALSLLLFLCALASKVSVVPLPLLLPFLAPGSAPAWNRKRALAALPYLGLAIVFAVIAAFGKETVGHFYLEQLLIGAMALVRLGASLVLPLWLTPLYPFTREIGFTEPHIAGSLAAASVVTALALFLLKRSRWPLFLWAWFTLFIVPSFGNFAKGHDELLDVYITSDRYAYIASLAPLLLLGFLLGRRHALLQKGAIAAIATLMLLSVRQTFTWRNNETFWLHALEVSPNSHIAHTNIGTILVKRGDIEGGRRAYAASLAIRPSALVYYNLGQILEYEGEAGKALTSYQKAVRQSPLETDAWRRIIVLLRQDGRFEEAEKALQEAKESNHGFTESL